MLCCQKLLNSIKYYNLPALLIVMAKGYRVEEGKIILDRELTELDCFVQEFLAVLKKHSDYLVVSGYVSIATGRTRGTEDIDVIIPVMGLKKFESLFEGISYSFWCYQGDEAKPRVLISFYPLFFLLKIKENVPFL